MKLKWLNLTLMILSLGTPAFAQKNTPSTAGGVPEASRVSVQKCGSYTVRSTDHAWSENSNFIELSYKNKIYARLTDTSVSMQLCRDLIGDGVPEVLLMQFSGGAHCCAPHTLYSLTVPPHTLLRAFSGHSDSLEVRQLDGKGPPELLGYDWRFAYTYGLSFAGSPALPTVYRYLGGRYVEDSRSFPGVILGRTQRSGTDVAPGDYLYDLAALLVVGKPGEAQSYLESTPPDIRAWLSNYLPDIRQSLGDYGAQDWPQRAGLPDDVAASGVGGSFSAPGVREYAALVGASQSASNTLPNGIGALMLFRSSGGTVQASKTLMTFPKAPGGELYRTFWWPAYSVRRADGRDDLVVRDARNGDVRFGAYRLDSTQATRTQDALSAGLVMLSDLVTLADANGALRETSARRTASERAALGSRRSGALSKVQAWLKLAPQSFDPTQLVLAGIAALEFSQDTATKATLRVPLELSVTPTGSSERYGVPQRYTLTLVLEKADTGWRVVSWSLTVRDGEMTG